jgi:hypothetical protein
VAIDNAGQIVGSFSMQLSDGKLHTYGFIPVPSTLGAGPLINGVIGASAFGGAVTVAAGSWIEIYGDRLAESARQWQSSDFSGTRAPVSLDGVSVEINGQAALVSYISPGQVNAQVPAPSSSLMALFPDGTYVWYEGIDPGLPSRVARAGDTVVLYAIGFGPVTVLYAGLAVGFVAGSQTSGTQLSYTLNGVLSPLGGFAVGQ